MNGGRVCNLLVFPGQYQLDRGGSVDCQSGWSDGVGR